MDSVWNGVVVDARERSACEIVHCSISIDGVKRDECDWCRPTSKREKCAHGTLSDPRMGPREKKEICETCSKENCFFGHFGHVELGRYVILRHFEPFLIATIKSICKICRRRRRGSNEKKCVENKKCFKPERVKSNRDGTITVDDRVWTAEEVRDFVQCVPEAFNTITDVLPVISNVHRPFTKTGDGKWRPHRWSAAYAKVIRAAKDCRRQGKIRGGEARTLYFAVNACFSSSSSSSTGGGGGGGGEGLLDSLASKQGRLRQNLLGKRVDHCGRCVISGDTYLPWNVLGIPDRLISKLTVPIVVTSFNKNEMRKVIEKGEWSTLKKIEDGTLWNSSNSSSCLPQLASNLREGDLVRRWLRNGDRVLFNRQPTLHRGSMMSFKVELVPNKTFQMNVSVTPPFNADFDGDEMNVYVPQSLGAKADCETLMSVEENVVGSNGRAQITFVQNALTGIYKLTRRDCFLENHEFYDLFMLVKESSFPPEPTIFCGTKRLWTGCQLMNELIPKGKIDWTMKEIYERDWLFFGPLTKKKMTGLVESLSRIRGGLDVTHRIQIAASEFLERKGTSLGLDEFVSVKNKHHGAVASFDEIRSLTDSLTSEQNSIREMYVSGSKGSATNMVSVGTCLGQQSVAGRTEPPRTMNDGKRVLPSDPLNESTPGSVTSTGYVSSGYLEGLNPVEATIHQMSSRYGLIVKTLMVSTSGTRSRQLTHRLESMVCTNSGLIVDDEGNVIQFEFGGDGLDPKKINPNAGSFNDRLPNPSRWDDVGLPFDDLNNDEKIPFSIARRYSNKRLRSLEDFEKLKLTCERAKIQPGEPIGMATAHALSEPSTQAMLDAFHDPSGGGNGGVGTAGGGGDASKRLFDASAPSITEIREFLLEGEDSKNVEVKTRKLESLITYKKRNLSSSKWMERHERVFGPFPEAPYYCLLTFLNSCTETGLEMENRVREKFGWSCRASHFTYDPIKQLEIALPEAGSIVLDEIEKYFNYEDDEDEDVEDEEGKKKRKNKKKEIPVVGTKSSEDEHIVYYDTGHSSLPSTQWTEQRSCLLHTFLKHPWFDHTKTVSNDVKDVACVLGIEAARNVLKKQFLSVDAFKTAVDSRYIDFLCDVLTRTGTYESVGYGGYKKTSSASSSSSVMGKACYQFPIKAFVEAAIRSDGTKENSNNVSYATISGNTVPVGSGFTDTELILNEESLTKFCPFQEEEEEEESTWDSTLYYDPSFSALEDYEYVPTWRPPSPNYDPLPEEENEQEYVPPEENDENCRYSPSLMEYEPAVW